ncbi:MAG: hypothetical protein K2N68_00135 [Clostridia bacterium]|nr:hypothetical protein [Clostridia bacterium]
MPNSGALPPALQLSRMSSILTALSSSRFSAPSSENFTGSPAAITADLASP